MRNYLPVASLSTILGIAGFCGGLYLLVMGKIDVVGFGAVCSVCVPLLGMQEHTSVPTTATPTGEAVKVTAVPGAAP